MTLPAADTVVAYPSGSVASHGTVVSVAAVPGGLGVVLDSTAFHPVDGHWPDQPADRGQLVLPDGTRLDILDAVVGATDGEGLSLGADVPVRTGTEGWAFLVVHVVAADAVVQVGDRVGVEVDAAYRAALSAGHTACHLASLALDRALAEAWTKPVPTDALGAPAFDMLAIERSEILEHGARDTYRIGKSLRKKGFTVAALDEPAVVAARVNAQLAEWIAAGASVHVEAPEPGIGARRSWVCALPEGEARIPCGGTHVHALADLGRVEVSLSVQDADGARLVEMLTTVTR